MMDYITTCTTGYQGDGAESDDLFPTGSTLELLYQHGAFGPSIRKPRAPRQCPIKQQALTEQADEAFALLTDAELQGGATVKEALRKARRVNAAEVAAEDKKKMARICAAQRAGLIRALRVLEQTDSIFAMNDRVRDTVDIVLALSANMSAVSDSGWPSTESWLEKHLPFIAHQHGAQLEESFTAHLSEARAKLSRQVATRIHHWRTAPTPSEIAHRLTLTTHVLRVAKANTIGLTSIDPESKKERDRRTVTERRRASGVEAQADRTKDAGFKRLAVELDCHVRTIWRQDKAGNLDAYVEKRRAILASR